MKATNKSHFKNIFSKSYMGLLYTLPAIIFILFVLVYPLLMGILNSFKHYILTEPNNVKFVFFQNYINVFNDEHFLLTLFNTFIFVAIVIALSLLLGLVLSLILNQKIFFRNIFRGLSLLPWVIAPTLAASIFKYMFNSEVGIINYVLKRIGIIDQFIPWFGDGSTAFFVIIMITVWTQFPFHSLMYLAVLQTIPEEVNEAALIDGANIFQKFFYITLPYMKNVLIITSTLMVIWNFNAFDIIYTTTMGGPMYKTTTLSILTYIKAMSFYNIGEASAVGVIWFIILMFFANFYIRYIEKGAIVEE